MAGFFDFLRMGMGWWSSVPSTTPDQIEGITLRLLCTQSETLRLESTNSVTMKLRCTQSETFRLTAR
jgi:hypothetical protein